MGVSLYFYSRFGFEPEAIEIQDKSQVVSEFYEEEEGIKQATAITNNSIKMLKQRFKIS